MQYALRAVEAGKAALSEKPIADTVDIARACIARYRGMDRPAPWLVGENWRFLPVFADAAAVVSGKLGMVYKMDLACDIPFTKNQTCGTPKIMRTRFALCILATSCVAIAVESMH